MQRLERKPVKGAEHQPGHRLRAQPEGRGYRPGYGDQIIAVITACPPRSFSVSVTLPAAFSPSLMVSFMVSP